MSSHDPIRTTSRGSLSALVEQLKESCDTVARFQGGHTSYREELAIFKEQACAQGIFLDKAPLELNTPPDEEGNEHQVWYRKDEARFLKATWPDYFGMLAPIDLRVQSLSGSLLDSVCKLTHSSL